MHRGWSAHYLILTSLHSLRTYNDNPIGIPDWKWLPGTDFPLFLFYKIHNRFNNSSEGTWLPPKQENILNTPILFGQDPRLFSFFLKEAHVIKSLLLTVYMGNTWSLEDVKANLVAEKFTIQYDYKDIYDPNPNRLVDVGDISLRNTWEACDTRKCKNMTSCIYCTERLVEQQLLEIIFNDEEPIFTNVVTVGYSGRPFYVSDYSFRTGLSFN